MLETIQSLPLYVLIAGFLISAAVTWFAGSKVALFADGLADRFHLGQAFAGLLLLAAVTSLPEVASTLTASFYGNPSLAISNLFGSVITNAMILAMLDLFVMRRNALTFFAPKPSIALQGQFVIILVALTISALTIGEVVVILQVGLWSFLLFVLYAVAIYLSSQYEKTEGSQWQAVSVPDEAQLEEEEAGREQVREKEQQVKDETPTPKLLLFFAIGALVILFAGYLLAMTGDAIAEQTGLGASFFGTVILALATSLPEISTSTTALRTGNYSMAVSNLFGSNAALFALIFFNDIVYTEGPILQNLSASALFSLTMGIVLMTIYLIGMTERKNIMILNMGIDSLAVMIFYILSLVGLFYLQ